MEPGDLLAKMGDRTFVLLLVGKAQPQGDLFLWIIRRFGFKGRGVSVEGRSAPVQVLLGELATALLNTKT